MVDIELTKLEAAFLFNLSIYKDNDGWKDREMFRITNKNIKSAGKGLYFSSDLNNLTKIGQELVKKKLIEFRKRQYKDRQNRDCAKVEWRIKTDDITRDKLSETIKIYLICELKEYNERLRFIEFLRTYSPIANMPTPKTVLDKSDDNIKKLLKEYHVQGILLANLKRELKDIYGIDKKYL